MTPPVIVLWRDAWGSDVDVDISNLEHEPVETETLGWLLRSDYIGVTLAMDGYTAADMADSYRNTAFIPRGMIKRIIHLQRDSDGYEKTDQNTFTEFIKST